jgi:hypothetical protein
LHGDFRRFGLGARAATDVFSFFNNIQKAIQWHINERQQPAAPRQCQTFSCFVPIPELNARF